MRYCRFQTAQGPQFGKIESRVGVDTITAVLPPWPESAHSNTNTAFQSVPLWTVCSHAAPSNVGLPEASVTTNLSRPKSASGAVASPIALALTSPTPPAQSVIAGRALAVSISEPFTSPGVQSGWAASTAG